MYFSSASYSSLWTILAGICLVCAQNRPNIQCSEERGVPVQESIQQQCAKGQHGGSFLNAGAYGFYSEAHSALFAERGWPVRFEPARRWTSYVNPRLRLLCLQRCWSHVDPDAPRAVQKYTVVDKRLGSTWIIRADDARDVWHIPIMLPSGRGSDVVPAIELQQIPEDGPWWLPSRQSLPPMFIALHPENRIQCERGSSPSLQTFMRYYGSRWSTIQQMCATALNGGDPSFNMGGVCQPPDSSRAGYVYFQPNLTPSPELIAEGQSSFSTQATLRSAQLFCFYRCTCETDPENQAAKRKAGQFLNVPWMDSTLVAPVDDGMRIVSKGLPGSAYLQVLVRPFSFGRNVNTQLCSGDQCREVSHDVAAQVWRVPARRPLRIAHQPPLLLSDESNDAKESISPACRVECNGASDCSQDCPVCRVSRPKSEQVWVDRSRVTLFEIASCSQALIRSSWNGLLPRSSGTSACACNSTYVSFACCDTGNEGLVWERPEQQIGRLSL